MNVPRLQYDNTMDQYHFSKSPGKFRNDNFSPNQARIKNNVSVYSRKMKSPPGRNISNNFSTISPNMQSVELNSPMASMSKNYMMYHGNDMSTTFSDMKQMSLNHSKLTELFLKCFQLNPNLCNSEWQPSDASICNVNVD